MVQPRHVHEACFNGVEINGVEEIDGVEVDAMIQHERAAKF